ncbi:DUF4913 domain-containing protein, partial [Bacillus subtilis]
MIMTGDVTDSARRFPSLVAFLHYLATIYNRQVTDIHEVTWCPEPWAHPEAELRLTELWRTYEDAQLGPV